MAVVLFVQGYFSSLPANTISFSDNLTILQSRISVSNASSITSELLSREILKTCEGIIGIIQLNDEGIMIEVGQMSKSPLNFTFEVYKDIIKVYDLILPQKKLDSFNDCLTIEFNDFQKIWKESIKTASIFDESMNVGTIGLFKTIDNCIWIFQSKESKYLEDSKKWLQFMVNIPTNKIN